MELSELVTRPGQKVSSLDKHFEQQLQQQQAALSMSPGPAVWVSAAAQANATQVRGHLLVSTALKEPLFKTEFYTTLRMQMVSAPRQMPMKLNGIQLGVSSFCVSY